MLDRLRRASLALALVGFAGGLAAQPFPFAEPAFRDIEEEPAAIQLADLDGDDIADLLVIQGTSTGHALCYLGAGDGTFPAEPSDTMTLYLDSNGGVVADFDNDGVLDVAATNGACSS